MAEDLPKLIDHLFRREAGKMVSYLTGIFGLRRLDLAEDVVQDVLCRAMEAWSLQGLPENPSAWLMRTARNRAIDLVRRDRHFQTFAPELAHLLKPSEPSFVDSLSFEQQIQDDQLRLMFSCCHPDLAIEAQVTLILKTLCGFSVAEIAGAFLVSEDSIEKRLFRARQLFRKSGALVQLGNPADVASRLESVYQAVYLLFNEGYHGSQSEKVVREDLCFEALRLTLLMSQHPEGATPRTFALLALFCFHAARLSGRMDDDGNLLQLSTQDRSKWDRQLIRRGFAFLDQSSAGTHLSEYHLEAAIAAVHCAAETYQATPWPRILELYDLLYQMKPSPIVALNRAIAMGKALGPDKGLAELESLPDAARLQDYPFYPAAQGEFHFLAGRPQRAAAFFEQALNLARTPSEISFFRSRHDAVAVKRIN